MNSKKCLKSLIDGLGGEHADIRETIERIDISGRVPPEQSDSFKISYKELFKEIPGEWSASIRDGEFSKISIDQITNEDITLIVNKPVGGRVFFATLAGFSTALDDDALTLSRELLVLGSFTGFKTRRFSVFPWNGVPLPNLTCYDPNPDTIDPRKVIVRDLTGTTVPADPYRWILSGDKGRGEPWKVWQKKATQKLATLFVSEVWKEDKTKITINGPRKHTFALEKEIFDQNFYEKICQASEWLLVKQDTEARHEVIVRRLSAIIRDSDANTEWLTVLSKTLQEALDGARLDHRAYVRSKSAETVKAMADLRKAVGEDVSRIVERVHRLSTGFIVGLAALATGLGVRLTLLTSQKNTWPTIGIIFCIVVLAITWASIILQRHISSKSLVNELRNMRRWHKNVHTALTRSDYRELALHPILDAVKLYKKTAKYTNRGMIFASIIFFAFFIAIPLLHSADKPLTTTIEGDQTLTSSATDTKATAIFQNVIQKPEVLSETVIKREIKGHLLNKKGIKD
ncbi:hypothetical protein [Marichromatium gracile]|uniref:hypothetical protein n=1 Tax=Marichromatium gracile TaxID=1048 RepID=UPI000AE3B301|nr:hypothetical protein [Marichromatium gracile]